MTTLRLTVPVLALLLSALGGRQLWQVWQALPGNQVRRLDWKAVNRARVALAGLPREGLLLVISADQHTAAYQRRVGCAQVIEDVRARLSELRHTQLGRVQLAGLVLLQLERDGALPHRWWPTARPYLAGLDRAELPHYLPELLDAEVAIFRGQGLSEGTARRLASSTLANAHGPPLQDITNRLSLLADDRRAAGDEEAAALCDRILLRLLRAWVVSPGPAGLRLLAADLLAARLDSCPAAQQSPQSGQIAHKLRLWRDSYRRAAAALPQVPPPLDIGAEPTAADGTCLARCLGIAGWTAGSLAVLAVLGITATLVLVRTAVAPFTPHVILGGCLTAGLIALTGSAVVRLAPELVQNDLRRLDTRGLGLPRVPALGVACGATVCGVAAWCLGKRSGPRQSWRRRLGSLATMTWLVTAGLLCLLAFWANHAWARYDRDLTIPPEQQLVRIADPNASGLLADLQAWQP